MAYTNRRAQQILQEPYGLCVQSGKLFASPEAVHQRLREILVSLHMRGARPNAPRASAMRFERGDGGTPLRLVAAPVPAAVGEPLVTDHCVIFLYANPIGLVDKEDFLKQAFGLTTTEARCALQLIAGDSVDEVAQRLGVSKATLRAHLRSLFAKTGTHRQGALIARLGRELAVLELA